MPLEVLESPRKRQNPNGWCGGLAGLSRRPLCLTEEVSEDEMSEDGERESENHVLVGERHPCWMFLPSTAPWHCSPF